MGDGMREPILTRSGGRIEEILDPLPRACGEFLPAQYVRPR